jgi:hypothetical protein
MRLRINKTLCCCALFLVARPALSADPPDWPALLQKPYEKLVVADIGLKPLLADGEGNLITTKEGWERARVKIRDRWKAFPSKPDIPTSW